MKLKQNASAYVVQHRYKIRDTIIIIHHDITLT